MTQKRVRKVGRPKGHKLTITDTLILRKIAKEGFQTYSELRMDILTHFSRTHSWAALKRLVTLGFLTECRGDGGGIRGWYLSLKARTGTHELFDPSWRVDIRPPVYRSAFDHDLALREIKRILCGSPCVSDWIPEHLLKGKAVQEFGRLRLEDRAAKLLRVPDARFNLAIRETVFRCALELEFTRKARKRWFQKLEIQITNPSYDFVFYVTIDDKVQEAIWNVYQGVVSHSSRLKVSREQNAVYFTTLEKLRRSGLNTPFAGLQETLILANLSLENEIISPDSV